MSDTFDPEPSYGRLDEKKKKEAVEFYEYLELNSAEVATWPEWMGGGRPRWKRIR